jgi:hypothetical protein
MTRTEELLALAEDSVAYCNKCGYIGKFEPLHNRPHNGTECAYQAVRLMHIRPEAIKQLVELVRLQNSALEFASDFIPTSCCKIGDCAVCKTIEAFDKWENGE